MKEALRNLVLVTGVVFISAFVLWSFLRFQALSQTVKPPLDHPFLKSTTTDIVAYHWFEVGKHPAYALDGLKKIAALSKDLVIWIDIRPNGPRPEDTALVAAVDANDTSGAPTLDDVLTALPDHRLILNFRANRPGMQEGVIKAIEAAKANDRILIQSPEDGFLKELREAKPLWIYGSSLPRVTQLEMLTSIGLEPIAPLKGDSLVIEFARERDSLKGNIEKLIAEGHRRKMKVFVGPVNAEEAARYATYGANGLLVRDPVPLLNQAQR